MYVCICYARKLLVVRGYFLLFYSIFLSACLGSSTRTQASGRGVRGAGPRDGMQEIMAQTKTDHNIMSKELCVRLPNVGRVRLSVQTNGSMPDCIARGYFLFSRKPAPVYFTRTRSQDKLTHTHTHTSVNKHIHT